MKVRIASWLLVFCGWAWPCSAFAQTWLEERETAMPFQLAVQKQVAAQALAFDSQAGFALSGVLPNTASGLDILELKWPKSQQVCQLGFAQVAAGFGQQLALPQTYIAVQTAGSAPKLIPSFSQGVTGVVARVCVWATASSPEARLVVLFSSSAGPDDSEVFGFTLAQDGTVTAVQTQHAATLYGWFECGDLNEDGSYELVTCRSLDANPGGFFYHAVRAFDAEQSSYSAQPELFKEYFSRELAWLDWVLSTRDQIQANPGQYLQQQEYGHLYTAEYEDVAYGFDSIIELPKTFTQVADIDEYNKQRRAALRLIQAYRDELRAWLDGAGSYPTIWKLTHE